MQVGYISWYCSSLNVGPPARNANMNRAIRPGGGGYVDAKRWFFLNIIKFGSLNRCHSSADCSPHLLAADAIGIVGSIADRNKAELGANRSSSLYCSIVFNLWEDCDVLSTPISALKGKWL